MLPESSISTRQAIPYIDSGRALSSNFPQASGGEGSLDAFLAKLNDRELRLLRDQLRGVQARVFAARAIRTLFAQFSRDALQELADSVE